MTPITTPKSFSFAPWMGVIKDHNFMDKASMWRRRVGRGIVLLANNKRPEIAQNKIYMCANPRHFKPVTGKKQNKKQTLLNPTRFSANSSVHLKDVPYCVHLFLQRWLLLAVCNGGRATAPMGGEGGSDSHALTNERMHGHSDFVIKKDSEDSI